MPTVESRDRPAAWQRISVNADMFGAGSGRALQQLGSTIASVGNAFGAQAEKNQAELDGIKAREIDTQVMKDYTQETAAYTLQNGEQAVNSSEAHEKRLLEIKENAIKASGGNKSVERMVRSSVEGQYRRAWSTAFGHKTKETIRYGDEVGDARITAATQEAQVSMDEEVLTNSISVITGETQGKQRRHNWSIEVTNQEIKDKSSKAYTGFVSNMARYYPDRAQEYFDKYKDQIDPAGIKAAEKAISDGFAGIGAKAPGDEAKRGSGPPQIPVRRPIPPMPPPPSAPIAPGRPGGQRSEAAPRVQLASLVTGTMSDAPQPGAQRLAEALPEKGLVEQGNIDLDNRPTVKNEDGSISTERSFSRNFDGKEVLLPLIREDGKVMTEDEAVEHYKKTGKHLGVFETPEDADAYAKGLSKRQQQKYAPGTAQAAGTASDAPAPGYVATRSEVQNYIVQAARLRGIDPGTAIRVYQEEGALSWKAAVPGETSYGPFQLYTGGGLGNKFIEAGHGDPSDPKTWKENIDFALNNVVEGGWGPWNGAKAAGIVGKMGVANNARVIPVGKSAGMELISTKEPVAGKDEDADEPVPKTPLEGRTLGSYRKSISEGDLTAKAPAGSRVIEAQNIPGRIRTLPPSPQLKSSFETAADKAGVVIRITSGGQTADRNPAKKDQPGGWTGSLRHTDGNAADVDILDESGKKLARNDPKRLKFLEEVAATGAGGIGSGYMDDPLKVHIGLTGGSGQVGVGLGVYSKESTPEEVAAIKQGLTRLAANGGPVAGPSVRGGHVRYAALSPTGTMSDAPQPGFQPPSAVQRLAQATTTDAVSPFNGPITADTTEANIKARMKWIEDDARAKGHEESYARSINSDMQAEWQSLKRQKIETHALAFKTVEDAVYGKNGEGKPKTRDEIMQDPAVKMQWDLLTNKEKEMMEVQLIKRNSVGENRPVTPEDMSRLDKLTVDAMSNPEVLRHVDLSEWPKGLRSKVVKLRDDLLINGIGGTKETKQLEAAMSNLDVGWQLTRAGIQKDTQEYRDVRAAMLGELRLWNESSDKPPTPEDLKIMTNRVMRTVVVPGRFWGTNEVRAFQQPLTKAEETTVVQEWNSRNPHDQVKEASEIKPDAIWHWRRKREEIEKRRIKGGYPQWP